MVVEYQLDIVTPKGVNKIPNQISLRGFPWYDRINALYECRKIQFDMARREGDVSRNDTQTSIKRGVSSTH